MGGGAGHQPVDGAQVLHASPVVHDKLLFSPVSREGGEESAPPLFFLHALSGEILMWLHPWMNEVVVTEPV